ncbi:hypothetical protein P2H44_22915 [Albimonas sp. CAU 1670]|uniref:hypothetical protein n=1 Tax=Albimonas sp. CAU 1670 TaxID=3032599 RepID=UPI0023DAFB04|nr:hypothetical protein [Albimonas sp. CAU 1670]MDF2235417.1 hypothetical protein [Albimonas sp. CAU 1670]
MVELVPGKTLAQKAPDLLVENKLAIGRWRFRLVVVDGAGNASRPVELVVQVADDPAPLIDARLRALLVDDVSTDLTRTDLRLTDAGLLRRL